MIFENSQIETEALPSVENIEFQKLAPAYRKVEYIGTSIFFAFLLVGCCVLLFTLPEEYRFISYIAFGIWAVMYALGMFIAGKQYDMAGYAVREHDVIHKHGLYWHTVTTIPYNRMQHVEISQGPVQNAFNLATLRIFTAGGTSSDLSIDGLEHTEAQRIKDFIANKISGNPAEEEQVGPPPPLLTRFGIEGLVEGGYSENTPGTRDEKQKQGFINPETPNPDLSREP